MRLVLAMCMIGGVWLYSKPARAQTCSLKLSNVRNVTWSAGPSGGYNVFDPTGYTQAVTFTVTHKNSPCAYFVGFSEGSAPSYSPRTLLSGATVLNYNLYNTASQTAILEDVPAATSTNILSGSFPNGNNSVNLTYYMYVPPQQMNAPATFKDTVVLSVYSGTLSNYVLQNQSSAVLSVPVLSSVQAAVVATGGAFSSTATSYTMDFGALFTNEGRTADIVVRSSGLYTLTLTSQNLQLLKNTTTGTTIGYTFKVNNAGVNLAAGTPVTIAHRVGPTPAAGTRYPCLATIKAFANAQPGTYKDFITVTVTAN